MPLTPFAVLILINVITFALPYFIDFGGFNNFESFLKLGWKDNQDIKDGEWYRLITSMFLHADIFHLLFNMYALFQLGAYALSILSFFTTSYATLVFVLVYFFSGICGSLMSFFFNPNPSVGASGAIFGLVGLILSIGFQSGNFGIITDMLTFTIINFIYGFIISKIDNFGHFGGLIAGFISGFVVVSLF
jgi:rhomboid protease GluP